MELLNSLSAIFDSPQSRAKPLSQREPITALLEGLLLDIIAAIEPDFFLEIGAFEADFSRKMKGLYPHSVALAIEANPRVFQHFEGAVKATGVDYRNLAITATQQEVGLYIPERIAGKEMPKIGRMGSLREVALRDSSTSLVTVQGETLDRLTRDFSYDSACVWIDVEGLADTVIAAGTETLSKASIVYVELESSPVWKDQALDQENIITLQNLGFQFVARDCQKWFQYNGLFLSSAAAKKDSVRKRVKEYLQEAEVLFTR